MKQFTERNQEDLNYELSEEDFKEFVDHHKYYLDIFQLMDWNCIYQFTELEEAVFATTNTGNITDRAALIKLNRRWPNFDYEETFNLQRVAKHEVLHLLVADLSKLAEERYTTRNEIWKAEEILIVKLEKLL